MALFFEFASRIESIIGLIAFGMAILLTISLKRLSALRRTASQFSDEGLKLEYLKNNGKFLPANWSSLKNKDAITLAEKQMAHTHSATRMYLIFVVAIMIGCFVFYLVLNSGCNTGDITISRTGEGSTNVGCM